MIERVLMVSRVWGVVISLLVAAPAAANSLDLNVHDNALRATYAHGIGAAQNLDLDVGYMYVENRADTTDHVFHIGLQVAGKNWSKQGVFDIGIGGRFVYVDTDFANSANIAFGGQVRLSPLYRVGIGGAAYYAPAITSFSDSDGYWEWTVMLDYQLLTNAFIYAGYRQMEFEHESGHDYEVDDHALVGMKLTF